MIALLNYTQAPAAETPFMSLSAFDWATVLALAALAWFLLVRDFRSRDELARTVQALAEAVGELRALMAEQYVNKDDHRRDIDRVSADIAMHAKQFQRELETHREECPARRG
jgi:hypothetical protein